MSGVGDYVGDIVKAVVIGVVVGFFLGPLIGLGAAASYALSVIQQRQLEKLNDGEASRNTGQTITGAVVPARWVLGRARVHGVLCRYVESEEYHSANAHLILSEGACDGIEKIYANGNELPVRNTRDVGGGVIEFQPGGRYFQGGFKEAFRGYELFDADGSDGLVFPNDFYVNSVDSDGNVDRVVDDYDRSTHPYTGISVAIMQYNQLEYEDQDDRIWKNNPALQTEFLMRGIKITWPGQVTPVWTRNAAAIRYWYMTERLGIPADAFDDASVRAAYALCNESVLNEQEDGRFRPDIRYAIDGVIDSTTRTTAILREMDFAWQGYAVEVSGVWHFRPGVDRPATKTLNPDAFISASVVQPQKAIQQRTNALSMTLQQSALHEFQPYEVPTVRDETAITRDGALYASDLGQVSFVTNPTAAARIQAIILRRDRVAASYTYRLRPTETLEWLSVIPTDRIVVNDPERGLDGVLMAVVSHRLHPDLSVEMVVVEAPDGIYHDSTVLDTVRPRMINVASSDDPVAPPELVSVISQGQILPDGTDSVSLLVRWRPRQGFGTEVRWRPAVDGSTALCWSDQGTRLCWGAPPSETLLWGHGDPGGAVAAWRQKPGVGFSLVINEVVPNQAYEVQVRHVDRTFQRSPWTAAPTIIAMGDRLPPGAPLLLSALPLSGQTAEFSWQNPTDQDFASTQIWRSKRRVRDDQTLDELVDVANQEGIERRFELALDSRSTGAVLSHAYVRAPVGYAIRSVDWSGNASPAYPAGQFDAVSPPFYFIWTGNVAFPLNTPIPMADRRFGDTGLDLQGNINNPVIGDVELHNTIFYYANVVGTTSTNPNHTTLVPASGDVSGVGLVFPNSVRNHNTILPASALNNGNSHSYRRIFGPVRNGRRDVLFFRWYVLTEGDQSLGIVYYLIGAESFRTNQRLTQGLGNTISTNLRITYFAGYPGFGSLPAWGLAS